MGEYFLWYNSRNYVDYICFSLPLGCSEPSVIKTHMITPEYYTLWLTSLIDHGFWNRGLLFFTTLTCFAPTAGYIFLLLSLSSP